MSGHKIRVLSVLFDTEMKAWEVEAFRGAVAAKVGLENEWFHNHNNTEEDSAEYHYRYPLVQYKVSRQNPKILFLEAGVDEAHLFFNQRDWSLRIGQELRTMRLKDLRLEEFRLGISEYPRRYHLHNWLALPSEHYAEYRQLPDEAARWAFLERKLANSILGLASGLGWHVEERIVTRLLACSAPKALPYKGIRLTAFTVDFEANVFLPFGLGIGKGASVGWGVLGPCKP